MKSKKLPATVGDSMLDIIYNNFPVEIGSLRRNYSSIWSNVRKQCLKQKRGNETNLENDGLKFMVLKSNMLSFII